MNTPYFLIVAGPTGSGKGSLPEFVANYLNLNKDVTKILIDDLVVANPFYRNEYNNWVAKNKHTVDTLKKEFLSPSKDTLQFFNDIYFAGRKKTNCITGEIINECNSNTCPTSCDSANDELLMSSLKNSKNIVFETTGVYFPDWLFTSFSNYLSNYKIIFAYPIVDICTLLMRNKTRAIAQLESYHNGTNKVPPRLPDINEKVYKENLIQIIATISSFLESRTDKCVANKLYCNIQVILVDNNSLQPKVLYDNYDTSQFRRAFEKYNVMGSCAPHNP